MSAMHQYLKLVENADIVIATGGGFITDPFQEHAMQLLQTLAMAKQQGKPIALFGQGLGPADSPNLLYWTKNIFPKLNLLTLREQKNSLPFALRAGAEKNRIQVTGDDAITLANSFTPERLGRLYRRKSSCGHLFWSTTGTVEYYSQYIQSSRQ